MYGPKKCVAAQKTFTHMVDNILIGKNNSSLTREPKDAFGLGNATHDDEFANQFPNHSTGILKLPPTSSTITAPTSAALMLSTRPPKRCETLPPSYSVQEGWIGVLARILNRAYARRRAAF